MNVKMKAKEIREKLVGLMSLGELTLPGKLSYAISYNIEKLEQEFNRLEKERVKICERYAEKEESGKAITVQFEENGFKREKYKFPSQEEEKACDEEYQELMETEIEFADMRTVKWDEIEKCEGNQRYSMPTVKNIGIMNFMLED